MGCSEHGYENLGPIVRGELFDWLKNCRFLKKSSVPWGRLFIPRNVLRPNHVLRSDAEIRLSSRSQVLSFFGVSKTDLRPCFML